MLIIHGMDEGSNMNDSMPASLSEFDIGLGDSHLVILGDNDFMGKHSKDLGCRCMWIRIRDWTKTGK